MANKLENTQFPGWGKSGKNDADFKKAIGDAFAARKEYVDLKNEFLEKRHILARTQHELAAGEAAGNLSPQDKKTLTNTIKSLDDELRQLAATIRAETKDAGEVFADPRYSEERFKFLHESGQDGQAE